MAVSAAMAVPKPTSGGQNHAWFGRAHRKCTKPTIDSSTVRVVNNAETTMVFFIRHRFFTDWGAHPNFAPAT